MKKVNFNHIGLIVPTTWELKNINDKHQRLISKRIGVSYCILDLHQVGSNTTLNKFYKNSLMRCKELSKFTLTCQHDVKAKAYHAKQREFNFFNVDSSSTVHVLEKLIAIDGEIYALSVRIPDCPLMPEYKLIIADIFDSITVGRSQMIGV